MSNLTTGDENQLNVKLDSYVCTGLNTCSKDVTTKNPPGIRNVTTASSRNVACPCVYGVAVHKGEIHPASFSDVTKGPLQDLRGAYSLYGSGNMLNIYKLVEFFVICEINKLRIMTIS